VTPTHVEGARATADSRQHQSPRRAYSTGPDSAVKIGPRFKPFCAKEGKDLGVSTWPADGWRHGAGAAWGWISYDPELNVVYYGTSNPGPWNQNQRPGDNKWTSTIFARDPDTGDAIWAYQVTPHDLWDYDAVNESILVDLPINGATRKVLVHFDRNAFAYTIDRTTGEVLVAKPFQDLNWSTGVDLKTGLPSVVSERRTMQGVNVTNICPPDIGGKDFQPAAFAPRTGLFYVPTNHMCMDYQGYEASYVAGATGYNPVLATRPYYRSTYVFVSRTDRHYRLGSSSDPRLAEANPPARLIDAVAAGDIDVAIARGPFVGYFARHEPATLDVVPVSPSVDGPGVSFVFDIAMGARKEDTALRDALNRVLVRRRSDLRRILASYGVPIVPRDTTAVTTPQESEYRPERRWRLHDAM
jgi:hypothetical protein